jgi:hypothetical protein
MTKKQAHKARMAELKAEAGRIVAGGKCPQCGAGLVRNLALAGWWQCGAYGSEGFRRPEFAGLPSCSFQTFTE